MARNIIVTLMAIGIVVVLVVINIIITVMAINIVVVLVVSDIMLVVINIIMVSGNKYCCGTDGNK